MEWLKKILENAKITDGKLNVDELVTQFNAEFPQHAVPKDVYNTLAATKRTLETDIQARDAQLETLKGVDVAGIQAEITRLQGENQQKDEALKDLAFSNAIKAALVGKVHDEGMVAGLFDKTKMVVDGDKVIGLDDQLGDLKKQKPFLFVPESTENDPPPGFQVGADGTKQETVTDAQIAQIFGI